MAKDSLSDSYADLPETGYLELNLDDAVPLEAVEAGEYELSISSARIGSKTPDSQSYLLVYFDIPEHPHAKPMTHVMMLPDPSKEDEKRTNQRKLDLLNFFRAFGVDYGGKLNPEELKGLTGWAHVKVEESPDYGEQNRVTRFVAPA